jgi:hypothetical protein
MSGVRWPVHRGVRLAQCSPTGSHCEGCVFYMQHDRCLHTPPSTLFSVRVHVSCTISARIVFCPAAPLHTALKLQGRLRPPTPPPLAIRARQRLLLPCRVGRPTQSTAVAPRRKRGQAAWPLALSCWWLWCWWLVGAHLVVSRTARAGCLRLNGKPSQTIVVVFLSLELWDCGRGQGGDSLPLPTVGW